MTREQGVLVHQGRLDRQVKVRGRRIELGEVEAALRRCPGVTEAVVLDVPRSGEGVHLRAVLTGDAERGADLRSEVVRLVPDYAVPESYVWLPQLPLNLSGKVDHHDFGPRANQQGFARLAGNLPGEEGVYLTVPLGIGADLRGEAEPERFVDRWAAALPEPDRPVRAIVTFCAGAAFADGLRRACTGPDGAPALVTIDPTEVGGELLRSEFVAATETFRAHMDEQMLADVTAVCDTLADSDDLPWVAERLREEQRRVVEHATARAGMPEHLRAMLSARFADYLGYLVAAARRTGRVECATVIASADHPLPGWCADHPSRLATRHDDQLGDPQVAGLVHGVITA